MRKNANNNVKKKRKRAGTNECTQLFYKQMSARTKGGKNNSITLTIIQSKLNLTKYISITVCNTKKTNEKRTEVVKNEEVPPSVTCKQATYVNLINLGKKDNQVQQKKDVKSKARRQIHIQT